jgi:hypothetical protein
MSRLAFVSRALLALPLAAIAVACGDGLDAVTTPGAAAGNPSPTATPVAATPTPVPATPTPTPVGAASCSLPERPDCGNNGCCTEGGTALFNSQINDAQAELERTRPDIVGTGGDVRVDEETYTAELAKMLMRLNPGMCAVGGGKGSSRSKDEVAIKTDNSVSQNVDVIIGSSHSHHVGGRYTCRPAAF